MTRTQSLLTAGVVIVAAIGVGWSIEVHRTAATAPANPTGSGVTVVDGVTIVQLDPAVQRRSGITSEPAKAVGSEATRRQVAVPGVVMDLQPWIDWRNRLLTARTQLSAAQAQLRASEQELRRTQALFADDQNASRKALEAAQAAQARDRAQLDAADSSLHAIEEQGRLQFGPALAGNPPIGRRESLVAVAIAPGVAPPAHLEIAPPDGQALAGTWIAGTAAADPKLGAGLQLYRVPSLLPANTTVIAYMGPETSGVLVPLPAVVWQAGQPWAYVRRDASHFARTALLGAAETRDGFVVPKAIRPGEQVVTQGAQLLLSQEQLPPAGSSGCKDPECD